MDVQFAFLLLAFEQFENWLSTPLFVPDRPPDFDDTGIGESPRSSEPHVETMASADFEPARVSLADANQLSGRPDTGARIPGRSSRDAD